MSVFQSTAVFTIRAGGSARHDAVAWGYARGADQRGVDIIQNCEVTGIDIEGGVVKGVQTTRGAIKAKKVWDCGGRALWSGRRNGRHAFAD